MCVLCAYVCLCVVCEFVCVFVYVWCGVCFLFICISVWCVSVSEYELFCFCIQKTCDHNQDKLMRAQILAVLVCFFLSFIID